MEILTFFFPIVWLFFLGYCFRLWLSLVEHTFQVFFPNHPRYTRMRQNFQKAFFQKEGVPFSLKEWDKKLLETWAEEEPLLPNCPVHLEPKAFVDWLQNFPMAPVYLVQENGTKIKTLGRDAGIDSAPVYVFLHGIWDSSYGFVPMAYHLWRRYQGKVRFIFQEMPGHGGHNTHREALSFHFTYPNLAKLVGARLSGQAYREDNTLYPAVKEAVVIGNSMGGSVSLLVLAHYPEYVRCAIPINPAIVPQKPIPAIFQLTRWVTPNQVKKLPKYPVVDIAVLQISSSKKYEGKQTAGHSVFQHWHRYAYIWHPDFAEISLKVVRDLLQMLENNVLQKEMIAHLQTIPPGKIFLVNGLDDLWLNIEQMPKTLIHDWKISLTSIPIAYAGHSAQCDQPKEIVEKIWKNLNFPTE